MSDIIKQIAFFLALALFFYCINDIHSIKYLGVCLATYLMIKLEGTIE